MPKISVIVPTENSEDELDALLLSIFVQAEQDVEIIIVDNVSADGTRHLLDRYVQFDKRIRVINLSTTTGIIDCCRRGIQQAAAPYIYLMDGTKMTYISQGCLMRLLQNLQKHDSDFVYSSCSMFSATTMAFSRLYQIESKKFVRKKVFNHEDIAADLLFRLHLSPFGKLYKRDFLRQIQSAEFTEAFFLECLFKAEKISYDLNGLYL